MTTACIIVAAGRGLRAGGALPKQYRLIGGESMLGRSVCAMLASQRIGCVLCVIHPDDREFYAQAVARIADPRLLPPVPGGQTRSDSVLCGLEALLESAPAHVLIHDAARPFVTRTIIDAVIDALDHSAAVLPALPVVDTLWHDGPAGPALLDRQGIWRAQTPQGFSYADILAAHRNRTGPATDDIAVARPAGLHVAMVAGSEANFKITGADDFLRAERSLGMDIRIGTGFDVHAFGPGNHVTLCGVNIAFSQALLGHSDADVAMHAITDAIFGGLALGDIGQWFPPSDPQWQGAASEIFLRKAVECAETAGLRINNLDCTLICELPKIAPLAQAMRQNIARICQIPMDRVSIKATTSEQLGFTGRGEGIAAMANVTLVSA